MKIEVDGLLPELKTQFLTADLVDCDATQKAFRSSLEVATESLICWFVLIHQNVSVFFNINQFLCKHYKSAWFMHNRRAVQKVTQTTLSGSVMFNSVWSSQFVGFVTSCFIM